MEVEVAQPRIFTPVVSSRHTANLGAILCILTVALLAAMLFSMTVGAVHVSLRTILEAAMAQHSVPASDATILLQVRLPRIIAAAIIGVVAAALAVHFGWRFYV